MELMKLEVDTLYHPELGYVEIKERKSPEEWACVSKDSNHKHNVNPADLKIEVAMKFIVVQPPIVMQKVHLRLIISEPMQAQLESLMKLTSAEA